MAPRTRTAGGGPASTAPQASGPATRRSTKRARLGSGAVEAPHDGFDDAAGAPFTRTRSAKPPPTRPVKTGSIMADPVARRGAPRGSIAVSLASLPSRAHSSEDDEQSSSDEALGAADGADQSSPSDFSGPVATVSDDDLKFMRLQMVELSHTAENLLTQYRPFTSAEMLARKKFRMSINGLSIIRQEFLVEGAASLDPFLDWAWSDNKASVTAEQAFTFRAGFALVNLATLMGIVYVGAADNLDEFDSPDVKALRVADEHFVVLLGGGQFPESDAVLDLAVMVRGARFVAALVEAGDKIRSKEEALRIAFDVYCARKGTSMQKGFDLAAALENGPYKPAAGATSEQVHARCHAQLQALMPFSWSKAGSFTGLPRMKQVIRPVDILGLIQDVYNEIAPLVRTALTKIKATEVNLVEEAATDDDDQAAERAPPGGWAAQPEGEGDDSDDSSESESQHITRATDTQAGPSIFRETIDLRLLANTESSSAARASVPPSNQQAAESTRRAVPRTLPVNQNATPLPFPPSLRQDTSETGSPANPRAGFLPSVFSSDDDPFEADPRADSEDVRRAKRQRLDREYAARVEQRLQERQRQQQTQQASQSQSQSQQASQSQSQQQTQPPPPSQALEVHTGSGPRKPAAAAAATTTTTTTATTVAALPPSQPPRSQDSRPREINLPRQRQPWSDHDSRVLLRLIAQGDCVRWAKIEKDGKELPNGFEHPRNQQAYRDRARNMKVDYLSADAPLPKNFDHVLLGNKERLKVIGCGRNPYRMERDNDGATGRPRNTEFRGEML